MCQNESLSHSGTVRKEINHFKGFKNNPNYFLEAPKINKTEVRRCITMGIWHKTTI